MPPPLLAGPPLSPRHCGAEQAVLQLQVAVDDHGLADVVQVGEGGGDVAAPPQGVARIVERGPTVCRVCQIRARDRVEAGQSREQRVNNIKISSSVRGRKILKLNRS